MGSKTNIEWTQGEDGTAGATWTPIRARFLEEQEDGSTKTRIGWHCEHASPGCINCYAEGINGRFGTHHAFTRQNRDKVEIFLDEKMLVEPLSWRKPRKIFVCSMTDIGADFVSDWMIDRIFAVAALCPRHEIIFLSKRSDRMAKYLADPNTVKRVAEAVSGLAPTGLDIRQTGLSFQIGGASAGFNLDVWPLRNATIGASVEDQRRADERRDPLTAIAYSGWRTWVSYEPALGPVDWTGWEFLTQIVGGTESGPGSRDHDLSWFRSTRDFCAGAGIAFFMKQITTAGRKIPVEQWPQDLVVREYPRA
jgi:protein gp37